MALCMSREEWRSISEAPDYEVSNLGRVRRVVPDWQGKYEGRIIAHRLSRGYPRVNLRVNGSMISRAVHRLVGTAFNGLCPPDKAHCAHRNGDRTDNRPENLYWATAKENCEDRDRHGTTYRGGHSPETLAKFSGENHYSRKTPERVRRGSSHWRTGKRGVGAKGEQMAEAKLSEDQVKEIFLSPRVHGSGKALAKKFGVSMGLIGHIRNGRAWRHVTDPLR